MVAILSPAQEIQMHRSLRAYFHCYTGANEWVTPYNDYVSSLRRSGLYNNLDHIYMGFVGSVEQRENAIRLIRGDLGDKLVVVAEEDRGYEQITLDILYRDTLKYEDFYCLYAHTKGAGGFHVHCKDGWREQMCEHTVERWEEAVALLKAGYDTVGIFWRDLPNRHFSGTFWWASSDYLRTLGPPTHESRFSAEFWIGSKSSVKHFDLFPGMPRLTPGSHGGHLQLLASGEVNTLVATVAQTCSGPQGQKLMPGTTVEIDRTDYSEMLVKSGNLILVEVSSALPSSL